MRGYIPSLTDIKNACEEIQKNWTEEERDRRWVDLKPVPYIVHSIDDSKSNKILNILDNSRFVT